MVTEPLRHQLITFRAERWARFCSVRTGKQFTALCRRPQPAIKLFFYIPGIRILLMTTQSFSATEEELELATQILVTRGCNGDNGVLQADQAKEVFNRSKLPPATLRVIWNMSNETGNHILSKHEIAKALRLIGWAQAGVMLSEKLSVTGMSSLKHNLGFGYDTRDTSFPNRWFVQLVRFQP